LSTAAAGAAPGVIDPGGALCYLLATVAKRIKKELKRPDEFVSFWTRFGEEASRIWAANKRQIIVAGTAMVTLIVGSVVFSEVAERNAVRATQALERVQKINTADLVPAGGTAKDDGLPHFATEKERVQAALKELDAFLAAEPHSRLRPQAQLQRGELLLALDRADEAVAVYDALLKDKLDDRLRFLAREGLGYAWERKGDLDKALAAFSQLGDDAASMGSFYKDRAPYQKARIEELRGNQDAAAKLYHEVLEKNPTTSLRDEITNRLAVLELK
jgi:tetratricopeptide (TPR) repeat protein